MASQNTPTLVTPTSKAHEEQARQHTAELQEIRHAITSLNGPPRKDDQVIKDMTLAIQEMKSATTKTTSTLTETENGNATLLREISTRQDKQLETITAKQDHQMEKMLANFQHMIKDMMKDMFQQFSAQMNSLLSTILPLLTQKQATPPPQQYANPPYAPPPATHPPPPNPTYTNHPMYPGGHQSTVAAVLS